jgi:hypothetical protein
VLLDSILRNPQSIDLHRVYISWISDAMMLIIDELRGGVR